MRPMPEMVQVPNESVCGFIKAYCKVCVFLGLFDNDDLLDSLFDDESK